MKEYERMRILKWSFLNWDQCASAGGGLMGYRDLVHVMARVSDFLLDDLQLKKNSAREFVLEKLK